MHHCTWAPAAASAGAGGLPRLSPAPTLFPCSLLPSPPSPCSPHLLPGLLSPVQLSLSDLLWYLLVQFAGQLSSMRVPAARTAHPGVTGASTVLPRVPGQPSRNVSHIWKCHLLTPSATRTRVTCPTLVRRSPHPQPQKGGNPEAYGCRSQLPTAAQPILDTPLCLPPPAAPPPIHQLPPDNTPSRFLNCGVP